MTGRAWRILAATLTFAASAAPAVAANLVADGGFETQSVANRVGVGDFFVGDACRLDVLFGGGQCRTRDPWSANNSVVFLAKGGAEFTDGVSSAEGSYHAYLAGQGQLFQFVTVATSGDYTLSWLEAGGRQADYSTALDYFVTFSSQANGYGSNQVATQFQPFTRREMALPGLVGGTTYQLNFIGFGRCCSTGSLLLDDVRIEAVAGIVPEPSAWTLLILGFGAVGAGLRRRPAVVVA